MVSAIVKGTSFLSNAIVTLTSAPGYPALYVNISYNLMHREDAQCLLASAAAMKAIIYFQIEQVQHPLIQLPVNIENTGDI